jgi:hypothetical protein
VPTKDETKQTFGWTTRSSTPSRLPVLSNVVSSTPLSSPPCITPSDRIQLRIDRYGKIGRTALMVN